MVDERPQLAASEIEAELLVELQKLPTLHDTQSVTIRPFSGPQGWTWELDSIEPEVGSEQSKFADVTNVVARLQQQFDLDPSALTPPGEPACDVIEEGTDPMQPNQPIPVTEPDVVHPPTPIEEPQPDKGPDLPQPGPDVVVPPGPEVITPPQPQEIPPERPA